ncbi:MAG: 1-acyl-sn-glycerol-3-phosphate acyltransferase, partial [Bacteroidota bacterium]
MNKQVKIYPPVIEEIEDWPIYKLHKDREAFVQEIEAFTLKRIMSQSPGAISDTIARTIYLEMIRVKEEPWKVDPPNERQFWKKIRKQLITKSLDKEEEQALAQNKEILQRIINRYTEEIVATFKIPTFRFARRFLTLFFNRLLNTAASRNFGRIYSRKYRLYERFRMEGALDEVRSLMKKGTVVVVPTHFSNLDSILIGYAMDAVLGLPSFSYGAGLNLYNTGYTAYYMNRLGAYRLDRRKKNPIYLETLKAMSNLALQRGTNSLFFPGGTRSRSGSIETKLKLGLFGTVVEAQRSLCQQGSDRKIFIVPLIIGYNTVLEAPFLIEQHLQQTGKESYFKMRDQGGSLRKIIKFAWQFFSKSSEIHLSFGQPLDVLGNPVNGEGESFDQHGNKLDIREYFLSDGVLKEDLQREREYTRQLGDKLVERYH